MNPTLVTMNTSSHTGRSRSVAIPVAVPDLADVHALAERLHAAGESFHDQVWGWEVTYEPEMNEPDAIVEVPDGEGGFVPVQMPMWTPASFTIGESGVWFYSLLWENGSDQAPVAFLDDRNVLSASEG